MKAIAVAPDNPHGFYGLGALFHRRGDQELALAHLDGALLLAPKMAYDWLSKGELDVEFVRCRRRRGAITKPVINSP